jgi:hypothetical protein
MRFLRNRYTQEEFETMPVDEYGIRHCSSGDYSLIKSFGKYCSFGEDCSFGQHCSFGTGCSFGKYCSFGTGCSFGKYCSFGQHCSFGEGCYFGEGCSFVEGCSFGRGCFFGEGCSFSFFPICILRASLGKVSDNLTLELMRRDAWSHPLPELFDIWATNGGCPYKGGKVERLHFFQEEKELWEPGLPTMRDSDLIKAICNEKGWKIP